MKDIDLFGDLLNKAKSELKQTNILILGKTGVGKSTLLNAIFGEDLAAVGCGKPCTEHIKEYSKEGFPIRLIDTRGLELENYEIILDQLHSEIDKRKRTPEPANYIHIAWYCINDGSKRIEEGELKIIRELSKKVPVIVVLTQSIDSDQTFFNEIEKICFDDADILKVLAKPYSTPIGTIPTFGLKELVSKTTEKIPEAHKQAFVAAQIVDIEIKVKMARKRVAIAATAAAAAGATPIPFADAAVLAPIQVTMLASISMAMGLDVTKAFLTTLVTSAAGIVGAQYVGKAIVAGLIKLIPGAGAVIGGVISGTTAATLTTAMGSAYIEALTYLIKNNKDLSATNISNTFKASLKLTTLKNN